ncbi:MAG: DUF945 family protein [Gammaproteobacteria bacterium]|nr:DUF945 family protein [Gammaproteobacteria bacterium]
MNKIAVVAVLGVAITAAVMPAVSGYVAENVTNQMVARLNASKEKFGKLRVIAYQRGYRSSNSSYEWGPRAASAGSKRPALLFDCHGQHGLLSYSYQCKAQDLQSYSDVVKRELGGFDPLTVSGKVSVFGEVTQRLSVQNFELQQASGQTITIYPGALTVVTDGTFSEFALNGKFAGLDSGGKSGTVQVGNMTVAGNLRINQHDLAIGDLSFMFESAKLGQQPEDSLIISGLTLNTRSEEEGTKISIGYQLGVSDFVYRQQQALPVDLRDMQMDFQLNGIAMQKMGILIKKLLALRAQADSNNNAYFLAMLPDLEALLKPGLAMQTRFSAEYLSQPVLSEIDLTLLGKLSFADYLLLRVSPSSVFAKIKASMNTQLPQLLLENHPPLKNAVLNNAWYSKTATGYGVEFHMEDTEINLNGQQIGVDELLGLIRRPSG